MITDEDIKKLTQKFATKEDLKQFATKIDLARLEIKMNLEFEKVREDMATKDDFRKVMTVLDKVLKEVLDMRQEQTMHVEDHRRINSRLEAIEQVPSVAQHLA